EEAPDRREIAPGERPAAAAEPEDLEEHAPDDRLLERDRVQPPGRDRAEAAEAEAREEGPAEDVEAHLHGVQEENAERRAVALHRPGGAHHPPPLVERLLHPFERRVRRRRRIEQTHGASITDTGRVWAPRTRIERSRGAM